MLSEYEIGFADGSESSAQTQLEQLKEYIENTEKYVEKKEQIVDFVKKYIEHQLWKLDNE